MNARVISPIERPDMPARALPVRIGRALVPQSARTRLKALAFLRTHPGGCIFVHVGKCGGTTLLDAFRQTLEQPIFHVHMVQPPVIPGARYALALRNPLSRFVSAFEHHKRSLETDRPERGDPAAIRAVFDAFDTVDALADNLYATDGSLNGPLARCLSRIGHLHRGLDFYLTRLLSQADRITIGPVFAQETLDDDIARHLGDVRPAQGRFAGARHWQESLSKIPAANLARYLSADFTCLEALVARGLVSDPQAKWLLDRPQSASSSQGAGP